MRTQHDRVEAKRCRGTIAVALTMIGGGSVGRRETGDNRDWPLSMTTNC
jgi:hypothetical protein